MPDAWRVFRGVVTALCCVCSMIFLIFPHLQDTNKEDTRHCSPHVLNTFISPQPLTVDTCPATASSWFLISIQIRISWLMIWSLSWLYGFFDLVKIMKFIVETHLLLIIIWSQLILISHSRLKLNQHSLYKSCRSCSH